MALPGLDEDDGLDSLDSLDSLEDSGAEAATYGGLGRPDLAVLVASSPPPDEGETHAEVGDTEGDPRPQTNDAEGGDSGAAGATQASVTSVTPEVKVLKKAKWIKHEVLPGERLDEISARYRVRKSSMIRWNKLDKNRPRIYAGRKLAVYTQYIPPPQQKLLYTVRYGDTWAKIAAAHRVDADHLRLRWNSKVPRKFKAGQTLVIWIDPLEDPDLIAASASADSSSGSSSGSHSSSGTGGGRSSAALPLKKIRRGSLSVGKPNKGTLRNGTKLPENSALYTIRKPEESYGSTHSLHNLQLAIAHFRRDTGYSGKIVIGAISKQGGGRIRPHSSHRTGRDVDIRLPLKPGGKRVSDNINDVDWDAAWGLIRALVATGEIQYIFLSTSRQKLLHRAAKRAGASKDMLTRIIQYPRSNGTNNGIVRNAKGHTAHFHVRFTCAANESRCESY